MRVNGRTESRKSVYFVSGIDTGIGKTAVTGLMARSLASAGRDVITVKLVQTGNDGYSEDIDAHRLICGGVRFPEDGAGLTAPQVFKFPSSPLLAAALEGQKTIQWCNIWSTSEKYLPKRLKITPTET